MTSPSQPTSPLDCMEYMPLTLKPMDDPNFDPGEHQVLDADTAHIFRLGCTRERAERIIASLNAAAALSQPTSPSVDALRAALEAVRFNLLRAGYETNSIMIEGIDSALSAPRVEPVKVDLLARARQFVADSGCDEDDDDVNSARDALLAEIDATLSTPSSKATDSIGKILFDNFYTGEPGEHAAIKTATAAIRALSAPRVEPVAAKESCFEGGPLKGDDAFYEIINRASNLCDPDAIEWLPSIYKVACEAVGKDPMPYLEAVGFGGKINTWPPRLAPPPSQPDTGVREALAECLGCVQAAEAEGLHEVISELRGFSEQTDRLIDLVERRLMWVRNYAEPILAALPPDAGSRKPALDPATVEAVKSFKRLTNEIAGIWDAFEYGIRAEISNTNYAVVKEKILESENALAALAGKEGS